MDCMENDFFNCCSFNDLNYFIFSTGYLALSIILLDSYKILKISRDNGVEEQIGFIEDVQKLSFKDNFQDIRCSH